MSERTVLLKLYRQFNHDEAVNYLRNELRKKDLEIGKLKSEINELKYKIGMNCADVKKEKTMWRDRYISLKNQLQNENGQN